MLHGAAAGAFGEALAVGEDRRHGGGERFRRRWLVAVVPVRVRDADARLVADELDRAAARRVRDRHPARHRLDHGGRARVVDLRMEEDVGAADDVGRLDLRVRAGEDDRRPEAEAPQGRRWVGDEPPAHEEPCARVGGEDVPERLERQLEPVGLRLVAAEEDDRPVGRRRAGREPLHVDRVREDLPRSARLAEERIGRALAEGALVDDMVGGADDSPERLVQLVGALARPARVRDAVLVDDDPRAAPARDPQQGPQVARKVGRAEVEERVVGRAVRPAGGELRELRRAACDLLARAGTRSQP